MISLSYADRRTRLGTMILDLTVSEEVEFEGEVTLYPIETGSLISDHITQGVKRVRISGCIPTTDVAALEADEDGTYKLVDIIEQLDALNAAQEAITVSTGQLLHTDMGITRLRASRKADAEGGNWLSLDAELIRIRKVELRTAEVPNEKKVAKPAKGRAGTTNKAAGRNTPKGEQFGPKAPGQSILKADQAGNGPINQAVQAARGVFAP